jgi:hypothetical protein
LEDPCVEERIILKYIKRTGWKVVDWTALAQKMDKWRDVVNAVMNIRVPYMRGICWLDEGLISFSKQNLLPEVILGIYIYRLTNSIWLQ